MVKIEIKKNVKPKTIKQKQKQKQTQNVTVNIGQVSKKKRGRTTQRKQIQQVKKPILQQQPASSFVGLQQPFFKPPVQQPSSLASAILATQDKPKVVKEEVAEQSALKKALIDQVAKTEDPITKGNDLERVRSERIKKFEKAIKDDIILPIESIPFNQPAPPVVRQQQQDIQNRSTLLSQLLSDKQDDTEEIQQLVPVLRQPDIPYSFDPYSFDTDESSSFVRKFKLGVNRETLNPLRITRLDQRNRLLGINTQPVAHDFYQSSLFSEVRPDKPFEPIDETQPDQIKFEQEAATSLPWMQEDETQAEIPLVQEAATSLPWMQEAPRGAAELVTQSEVQDEPQLLSRETTELGFGGLSEEPIQTSIGLAASDPGTQGQFLPPEPVSQEDLLRNQQQEPPKTLLNVIPYRTERLIKDENVDLPAPPVAAAAEPEPVIESESSQISKKWSQMKKNKDFEYSSKLGPSNEKKNASQLLNDIRSLEPLWTPIVKKGKNSKYAISITED
jgi:hypothetical protein